MFFVEVSFIVASTTSPPACTENMNMRLGKALKRLEILSGKSRTWSTGGRPSVSNICTQTIDTLTTIIIPPLNAMRDSSATELIERIKVGGTKRTSQQNTVMASCDGTTSSPMKPLSRPATASADASMLETMQKKPRSTTMKTRSKRPGVPYAMDPTSVPAVLHPA